MPDVKKMTKGVSRRVVKSLSAPDRPLPDPRNDFDLTPYQLQQMRDRELFEVRLNRP